MLENFKNEKNTKKEKKSSTLKLESEKKEIAKKIDEIMLKKFGSLEIKDTESPEEVKEKNEFKKKALTVLIYNRSTEIAKEILTKTKGLHCEMLGLWLWISGDTKQNKEILKSYGARYSKGNEKWYLSINPFEWARVPRGYSVNKYKETKYLQSDIDIVE